MMQKNLMDREWFNYDTLLRHDCLRTCLHHDMNHEWWLDLYIFCICKKNVAGVFTLLGWNYRFVLKKICMETTTTQNLIKLQSQLKTDIKSDGGHASAQHFIVHKRVQVIDLFKKCVVKSRHYRMILVDTIWLIRTIIQTWFNKIN